MPRPTAGQLRHPIVIESLGQTRDVHGGMVKVWSTVAAARAKINNMSGNESPTTASGGQAGEARTEFVTRYIPHITSGMRVSYGSRFYNIRHVNDFNEEHRFLILTCDTGAGNG